MNSLAEGTLSDASYAKELEELLLPTFTALPKNRLGNLEPAAVRYALHRAFMQQHGWSVRGLEPGGLRWNTTSPLKLLRGRVPASSLEIFETRLRERGFSLRDTVLLAATLEHLIHKEATELVRAAYQAHSLQPSASLAAKDVKNIMETYMSAYIVGVALPEMTAEWASRMRWEMPSAFPAWARTLEFVQGLQAEVVPSAGEGRWSFGDVERLVTLVGDRFGNAILDRQCNSIQQQLMQLEDKGTSCVGLNDFYGSNLVDGNWQFGEDESYLRQAGILEESDPMHPRVIVSNYMNSLSNCISGSGFYSVCCKNQCEDLLGHLEAQLQAPEGTPSQIASLVAGMGSASVVEGRTLPASLLLHLEEIASRHGGSRVPLHGRLFAQWMHHAYPLECPYPHVAGTTKQLRIEDWEASTGKSIIMNSVGMQEHAVTPDHPEGNGVGTCVPWSVEEELVAPLGAPGADVRAAWMVACSGVALSAFAMTILSIVLKHRRAPVSKTLARPSKSDMWELAI